GSPAYASHKSSIPALPVQLRPRHPWAYSWSLEYWTQTHSRERCLPRKKRFRKALSSARRPARVYPKTGDFAMRLSRHSARIKAEDKAKSPVLQATSGLYAGVTKPATTSAWLRVRRPGSASASTTRHASGSAIRADKTAWFSLWPPRMVLYAASSG